MVNTKSVTGVSKDWINELAIAYTINEEHGTGAATDYLKGQPVRTYGERIDYIVQRYSEPSEIASIRAQYSMNGDNRETVKRIDEHVYLLNRAAREGRLSDKMFRRFFNHLRRLVYGEHPPIILGEKSEWI